MPHVKDSGFGGLPLPEFREHVSKVRALMGLYDKRANSGAMGQPELLQVQHEMKVLKGEITSELLRLKGLAQRMQKALKGGVV